MSNAFLPGLDLCEAFFSGAVRPILDRHVPGLTYSAALIGPGSDVLGFDTPQSMDHDWGPRLLIFLTPDDVDAYTDALDQLLRRELPHQIAGYPTNFSRHDDGTAVMQASAGDVIHHGVKFYATGRYFESILGFDPGESCGLSDWLKVSEQKLLMVTAGRVFHDGLEQVEPIRRRLAYYPRDLWLYILAAQWRRIAQEEAFMGRCGQVGDDLGSRLVAGRLTRDLMRLCFLMERTYAPYIKWFDSAFARLRCGPELAPILTRVLSADTWQQRQIHLSAAYQFVAGMHNRLGITGALSTQSSQFHQRPFLVLHADRFVEAIRAQISDKAVLALPKYLGAADQFIDSTDATEHAEILSTKWWE